MPTITHASLSVEISAQLNMVMLHYAHWFYMPLNHISVISNVLLAAAWYYAQVDSSPYPLSWLLFLRVVLPSVLGIASTVYTVRNVLPINERFKHLPKEMEEARSISKESSTDAQELELRSLQRRWGALNTVRCIMLFGTAVLALTSPAMRSMYEVLA